MRMTRDELEYAISQYLDGVLPPLERSALEERLASDPEARAILAEYQALDSALKTSMPVPEIAWDQFTQQVRHALADEATPMKHYSLNAMAWTRRLAIAAAVLVAVGLGIYLLPSNPKPVAVDPVPPTNPGIVLVSGPSIATPTGPVVADVSIGPAPNLARQWRASEEIIVRPTIVQIDRGASSGQDSDVY